MKNLTVVEKQENGRYLEADKKRVMALLLKGESVTEISEDTGLQNYTRCIWRRNYLYGFIGRIY